jgi:uncharacterized phage infection (PIP) family protein YhgE
MKELQARYDQLVAEHSHPKAQLQKPLSAKYKASSGPSVAEEEESILELRRQIQQLQADLRRIDEGDSEDLEDEQTVLSDQLNWMNDLREQYEAELTRVEQIRNALVRESGLMEVRRDNDELRNQAAGLEAQITKTAQAIEQLSCVRDKDLLLHVLQKMPKSIADDDVRLAYARMAAEQPSLVKWKAQLETELQDLQQQLDALRQVELPDCQEELIEANEKARQGRGQSRIRDQINEIVAETKRIRKRSDAAQAASPAVEKLRQKNRAMISRVADAVTQLEAAVHQLQEREKLLPAKGDPKLLRAVAAMSDDFFKLAQLEQENREILDDLNDLYSSLANKQSTDLLSDLDQVVEQVIVGVAGNIEFADSRERQEYLELVKEREQLIRRSHSPRP